MQLSEGTIHAAPGEQQIELSRYLASVVHKIGSTRLTDEHRLLVRQHLLDSLGAAFLGCTGKAFADLASLCPRMPEGRGWPGSGLERVHPVDAGMLWSFAIHASVFEDGSREGACHPAAIVVPAIIALSEGKSWQAIDQAAIAGYDVTVRLARGGNPEFARKGFHPTAIVAPLGAAAAASLLLGHDLRTTQSALCMAAMGCAGLMAAFQSGDTQPLQVAAAVRTGLIAAMMAGFGHTGHPRIIEEGFYPAYLGNRPCVPLDMPLQHTYAIQGCYLKPYPGCRHLHPSIDALAEILKTNWINPGRVARIKVRTYGIAVETEIEALNTRGDAYFNIPYALAARMVLGRSDGDSFDERHFTNGDLLELMKKVSVQVDAEVDGLYPNQRGSIVEVYTVDGGMHSAWVRFPLGEPENPLPVSVIREKYRRAAGDFLSVEGLYRIESMLEIPYPTDSAASLFKTASENTQPRQGRTR